MGLEAIRAGAAARDQCRFQAGRLQGGDRGFHLDDGGIELGLALRVVFQVLHGTLVRLDAGEYQAGRSVDGPGDLDRGLGGRDAAAARTAIDLDQAFEGRAMLLRGGRKLIHVRQVIDADGDPAAMFRQLREAVDLERVAHLVRDEDVLDPAAGEDLGLGNLLAADADGTTQSLLQLLHVDRLVHLAVAAVAHAVRFGVIAHFPDVAFQRVEIEDQARGLDIRLGHARQGGYVIADDVAGEIRLRVHARRSELQSRLSGSAWLRLMTTPARLYANMLRVPIGPRHSRGVASACPINNRRPVRPAGAGRWRLPAGQSSD